MMKKLAVIVAVIVLAISFHVVVNAQTDVSESSKKQGLNIEISPARLLLKGAPGKKIDAQLSIRNRNAGVEQLKIEIMKVKVDNDIIEILEPQPGEEFPTWVSFGKKIPISAPFDRTVTVPIEINIPKSAAFAYDYAIVISKLDAPTIEPGTTQAVEGKVAQFILLDVIAPGAIRRAEISNFYSDKSRYSFLPATLKAEIKNTGNLHVTPTGNIFIKDMFGREVASLFVNKETGVILPNGSRTYETVWNQGFPRYETIDGKDKLVWNWQDISNIRIGKFKAEALVIYDDGTRDIPLNSSTSFWVIPWIPILILLIIIAMILGGLFVTVRSIWRLIKSHKPKTKKRN